VARVFCARGEYPDRRTLIIDPITDYLDQLEVQLLEAKKKNGVNLGPLLGHLHAVILCPALFFVQPSTAASFADDEGCVALLHQTAHIANESRRTAERFPCCIITLKDRTHFQKRTNLFGSRLEQERLADGLTGFLVDDVPEVQALLQISLEPFLDDGMPPALQFGSLS